MVSHGQRGVHTCYLRVHQSILLLFVLLCALLMASAPAICLGRKRIFVYELYQGNVWDALIVVSKGYKKIAHVYMF
jgi:hypothetical protein